MLAQKLRELIGIEISQHLVACYESGHISLIGEFLHFLVRLSIYTDVDDVEAVPLLGEIILRVNAP